MLNAAILIIHTMKTTFLIITFLVSSQLFSQKAISKNVSTVTDNISFFDNSDFTLEYFLVDGEREDLDLTNPLIPHMIFKLNDETNLLDTEIGGYCNATSAKYEVNENHLIVISRSATTLVDCGSDEETDFFDPITGNIYMQQPPEKVYYEITEDNKGLWLWMVENHKLFFTKETLGINENILDKLIQVFPNPANDYLTIKSSTVQIFKVSIFDIQGKEVLIKTTGFDKIDLTNLDQGIYVVKLKTDSSILTKKIILY